MTEVRRVVIIGAGGFAREVLDIVEALPHALVCEGFLVEEEHGRPGTLVNDRPILGGLDWLIGRTDQVGVVCAIGSPSVRRRLVAEAQALGASFLTIVHPDARTTRWVRIGEGSVICAGAVLTNQIKIGSHVHINLNCTVGHDAVIHSFSTLSPGVHVSGHVEIGEGAYMGSGSTIIERRHLGRWSIIGAGSTVLEDIPANSTAVGVPARPIKTRAEGWHLL